MSNCSFSIEDNNEISIVLRNKTTNMVKFFNKCDKYDFPT